jgi:hypothetical protein
VVVDTVVDIVEEVVLDRHTFAAADTEQHMYTGVFDKVEEPKGPYRAWRSFEDKAHNIHFP